MGGFSSTRLGNPLFLALGTEGKSSSVSAFFCAFFCSPLIGLGTLHVSSDFFEGRGAEVLRGLKWPAMLSLVFGYSDPNFWVCLSGGRPTGLFPVDVEGLVGVRADNVRLNKFVLGRFRTVALGGNSKTFRLLTSAAARKVADRVRTPIGLLLFSVLNGSNTASSGIGFLKRASAFTFVSPILCKNSYSYSRKRVLQRMRRCDGGFTEAIRFKGSWSQMTVNGLPNRYGLKCKIA